MQAAKIKLNIWTNTNCSLKDAQMLADFMNSGLSIISQIEIIEVVKDKWYMLAGTQIAKDHFIKMQAIMQEQLEKKKEIV